MPKALKKTITFGDRELDLTEEFPTGDSQLKYLTQPIKLIAFKYSYFRDSATDAALLNSIQLVFQHGWETPIFWGKCEVGRTEKKWARLDIDPSKTIREVRMFIEEDGSFFGIQFLSDQLEIIAEDEFGKAEQDYQLNSDWATVQEVPENHQIIGLAANTEEVSIKRIGFVLASYDE